MKGLLCAGIGATMVLAACGNGPLPMGVGGGPGHETGRLHISTLASTTITAPDKVNVGKGFDVYFKTVARGCDDPADVTTATTGAAVTLTPFNVNTAMSGSMCPMYVTTVTRTARASFTTPGFDTLSVYGYVGGTYESPQLGTIQKVIEVLP